MKFLFALQCGKAGGTERVALYLMKQLKARGHHCEVVSLEPIEGLAPLLAEADIPSYEFDFRKQLGLFAAFRASGASLPATSPTHCFRWDIGWSPRSWRSRAMCRAKTYILHHHAGAKAVWSWRINYLLAFLAYPKHAFLTEFTRSEAVKLFPPVRSRSSILFAPIDLHPLTTPEQRRDARGRLGLPAQAWIIGNAGRQVPVKRFDVFLRTAARIVAVRPDAHFALGGDGPERGALRALAKELRLETEESRGSIGSTTWTASIAHSTCSCSIRIGTHWE